MTQRLYTRWITLLAAHRLALTIILLAVGILFSALSSRIRWQSDVLLFSSASADLRNMREAQQQPGLATQIRVDLHAENADVPSLAAAAKDLAQKLTTTQKFRSVWTGPDPTALATAYANLAAQGPALLTEDQQKQIVARATPDYLSHRFTDIRQHLTDPDGELLARQFASDPLNLADTLRTNLQSLSPAASTTTLQDGVLMTRDKQNNLHAMLALDPFALPSDQRASEETLAAIQSALAQTQSQYPTLRAWVVGPHRGYVENARQVIADVTLVSILGTLAVAFAIALYFRRISTALLCIIPPSIGVGLAMGLAGIFHITLPLLLLGFTGLLCGSTTDYGIQIIAECRRLFSANSNTWSPDFPAAAAHRLLGPISMSVATSVTGFAALALSDAPGLVALGLFVAAATLCIWLITFLILPAYLGPWILPKSNWPTMQIPKPLRRIAAIAMLLLTAALLIYAAKVHFNDDPHALDGSSAPLLAEQQSFFDVWGDLRNHAIVLISEPTPAGSLITLERVDQYLRDQQRDGLIADVTSIAPLLPSTETANARLSNWQSLWPTEKRDALRTDLTAAATQNHFNPQSVTTYADTLSTLSIPPAEERLQSSPAALFPGFIDNNSHTLALIVTMRSDRSLRMTTGWAAELRMRFPTIAILSGNLLVFDATDRSRAEGERLAPWCLLAILIPLTIYFRKLTTAWLAATCLLVGFIWVLGAAELLAGGLNLLSLVPILFTLGVAVDYGIYAASDPTANRTSATCLCALTTILGSGSLILAGHPAMRWLGITLVAGITGGYLTSFFLVAPLSRPRTKNAHTKFATIYLTVLRWGGIAILVLLTCLIAIPPITQLILNHQQNDFPQAPLSYPPLKQIAARTFTQANSWMRWHPAPNNSGLWEITLAGNPYERGHAECVLASPIDIRLENEMLDQLDYFLPSEPARYLILRTVAANMTTLPDYIAPEYQQEIFASTQFPFDPHAYLAPAYPRILSYHALHDISQMLIDNPLIVPASFACTGVVSTPSYSAKQNGHLFLARNFDFEGGESFSRQKSITYVLPSDPTSIPFAHVAWPGLAGSVTGMNREKIGLFINAAASSDFQRIGTPTILVARDILQHAHNLTEAETILKNAHTFVTDILVIGDGKTGQVRIFEKSPLRFDAYDVPSSAAIGNHLITPAFATDPVNLERKREGTTTQRTTRARALLDALQNNVTPDALAALLRDKKGANDSDLGYGNRNAIDGLIACHSVIMDLTSGHMWVSTYPNAEGAFIGIDALAMLDHASANPTLAPTSSPPDLPIATIMIDGTWERIVQARAQAVLAEKSLRDRDPPAALAAAKSVVNNNPSFYWGHVLCGKALLLTDDKINAKIEFQRALELDPPYNPQKNAIEELLKKCSTP